MLIGNGLALNWEFVRCHRLMLSLCNMGKPPSSHPKLRKKKLHYPNVLRNQWRIFFFFTLSLVQFKYRPANEKRWFRVHEFNKSDMGHCFRIYCMFRNFFEISSIFFLFHSENSKRYFPIRSFCTWFSFVLEFSIFFLFFAKNLVNNGIWG